METYDTFMGNGFIKALIKNYKNLLGRILTIKSL